jgi:hypothetical protein
VLTLDLVLDPEVEIPRVPSVGLARKDTGDLVALLPIVFHKDTPKTRFSTPFRWLSCGVRSGLTLTAMVSWVYITVCFQCVYYTHPPKLRQSTAPRTSLTRLSGIHLGVRSGAERDPLMTSVKVGIEPSQKGVDVCARA